MKFEKNSIIAMTCFVIMSGVLIATIISNNPNTELNASAASFVSFSNNGASIDSAPIDLTFIKPEVPIIDQLNASNYRTLYMDDETYLRITRGGSIQVSIDKGLVWEKYDTTNVTAEYFTDWLERNDPIPDGYSRREMLKKIKNGAQILHSNFKNGKEMFFIIDDTEAQIELCTPTKLVSVLIDGQRLMITFDRSPHLVSVESLQSFYDLMISSHILTRTEAEQDYNTRIQYLKKNGFM